MSPKKGKKLVQRYVRQTFELPVEVVRMQREYATRVTHSMAVLAIEAFDASRLMVPQGFRELISHVIPSGNADEMYARVVDMSRQYVETWFGDDRTPLEKIVQSVDTIETAEGDTFTLRALLKEDGESMKSMYSRLSDADRRTRFFAMVTPEAAAKSGYECSSLVQGDEAHDYVLVDEEGGVIGHTGYATASDGSASLHIVLSPDARVRTAGGERISNLMFEKAIATAYLDERVSTIVAETLLDNTGVNKLVSRTLGMRDGFHKSFDYGYIESSVPSGR